MKKLIIIGAGVSGLAAGIYALQSGFETEIYEKHTMTGGVCTSWTRKGYTFEGAVHWLTGSSPHSSFYRVYKETGILSDSVKTYRYDPYVVFDYKGHTLCMYRDIKKLKNHFLEISPQDKKAINCLCKDIKAFLGMEMPLTDEKGVKVHTKSSLSFTQCMGMLPAIARMQKLFTITAAEYTAHFSHEGLRTMLTSIIPEGYNAMSLMTVLATFSNNGDFPQGGALALTKRMTDLYTSLGGKLFLSTKVDSIKVENGKACGIITDGVYHAADALIVTQDVITAVQTLFDNPPQDEWIKSIQKNTIPQMCTFIGIGLRIPLPEVPHQFCFESSIPVKIAGKTHTFLSIYNYTEHPEYAPQGGATLTLCFVDDTYEWWARAKAEGRYADEKKALSEQIECALIEKFPQLKDTIEVIDVATPLTYERYTGSYKGSWMSLMPPHTAMAAHPITCQDIENLYFAGFRTQIPGGLPSALISARRSVQLLCKQFDAVFQSQLKTRQQTSDSSKK